MDQCRDQTINILREVGSSIPGNQVTDKFFLLTWQIYLDTISARAQNFEQQNTGTSWLRGPADQFGRKLEV